MPDQVRHDDNGKIESNPYVPYVTMWFKENIKSMRCRIKSGMTHQKMNTKQTSMFLCDYAVTLKQLKKVL
jgi:hypothetical protein